MRRGVVFVLLAKIALSWLIGCFAESETAETSLSYPPHPLPNTLHHFTSSFLPPIPNKDVALVVDVDGKFYFIDTESRKIVWSWSSSLPIYSSYQNIPKTPTVFTNTTTSIDSDVFVDCGDDWQLYFYRNGTQIAKVPSSVEDYVRTTPAVSNDGGVTLGSRKTTVFVIDASSGKLIRTFKLPDSPSNTVGPHILETNPLMLNENAGEFVEENLKTVEELLYIKRTDYALQHHSPINGQVLWSVSFAEFDASFGFPGLGEIHNMKPIILRIRDRSLMESLSIFDSVVHGLPGGKPIPLPPPEHSLVPAAFAKTLKITTAGREVLALPSRVAGNSGISGRNGSGVAEMLFLSVVAETVARYSVNLFIPFLSALLSIVGVVLYRHLSLRKDNRSRKHAEELKMQVAVSRKKKNRKLGNKKTNVSVEKDSNYSSDEFQGGERNSFLLLTDVGSGHIDGRKIGKLIVSNKEIAKGSNGTVVLEGICDGRPVAVKRLLRTHHDIASKEIQNLIASDQHPNVVRWYGVEKDQDFVYLSLERCICSLNDLIYVSSESYQSQVITINPDSEIPDEYTLRLHKIKEDNKDLELWKTNGYPTPQLLKLMRDVVSGIAHLHELGIIHRDLKPQNVLINKDKFLSAKLSDMGISKRLPGDMSSITIHATGCGSSGWQAPEQLLRQRQTRAVDLFSLGCVLFFCVTGGKHPYGDSIERDVNIVHDRKDLFLVDNMPEAVDLFMRLLDPNPDLRPTAIGVLHHPFFWSAEMRLSFLRDVSDRVELEDRESDSQLLDSLENTARAALNGKWDEKMEAAFINDIGRYRRYKYDSVRDLLRVVRNKLNHYRELPRNIQELLGPVPDEFDGYFTSRFPRLLIEVYNVVSLHCREEEFFLKYATSNII